MWKLSVILLLAPAAFGQTFDVASVKLSGPTSTGSHIIDNPDRFEFLYANVRSLLALAYHVNARDVEGPDWISSEAIDVIATKPPNTTEEGKRLMLQALLAERFQLVVHRDSREVQSYRLVVQKGGPKIQAADDPGPSSRMTVGKKNAPVRLLSGKMSLERLAMSLQAQLESPVADATGLPGFFDVKLQWSPEDAIAAELPEAVFPPLTKALEQQLGLKLEKQKTRIETLVVDSGQKVPTGN
jgi:uncharacterized protein (TIGR03435 family)